MKDFTFTEYGEDRIVIRPLNGILNIKTPVRLEKYHLVMIDDGELTVDVNHKIFNMKRYSTIHLNNGDIIRNIEVVKEVHGFHLCFSPGFQSEIRTTRKSPINIQLKKEFPFQEFTEEEYEFLNVAIDRLKHYISDETHTYRSLVIKNEVLSLLLNISDKRRKEHGNHMEQATHKYVIMERFKSLLNGHCNVHHDVAWYADAMMISPDYLSKIIREINGRSARAMINESIINNAKFMMKQSDLSLKEISERLNFNDQSSFGRFFKANTGQSPKEFRMEMTRDKDE